MSEAIRLSTGRVIKANQGVIGINDALCVCEGYDGHIDGLPSIENPPDDTVQAEIDREYTWTPAERAELADRMIALWTRFKEAAGR